MEEAVNAELDRQQKTFDDDAGLANWRCRCIVPFAAETLARPREDRFSTLKEAYARAAEKAEWRMVLLS
jgi:hypothetical protein